MNFLEFNESHSLYSQSLELRYTTFFKEFGLDKSVTADELEDVSKHFAIQNENDLIAYGRLSPVTPEVYRVSQIVVIQAYRNQGIAKQLIKTMISFAAIKGANKIQLNSQVHAQGLYQSLGFRPVGEPYQVKLTGVNHVNMALEI
jgi:predicted GNAT family N-acyltransferase